MMKSLLLSFLLVLSFKSYALESVVVDSLNQGSCWLTQSEEGVSLVSFNDKKSKLLSGPDVQNFIQKSLGPDEQQVHSVRTFVHCSSHSLAVVFNISTDRGSVCLWSGLGEDSELVVRNLGHLGQASPKQFCDGALFGELIIVASSAQAINPLKEELTHLLGNEDNFKVKALGERIFKVTLAQKFKFQEAKVKAELLKSEALLSVIKSIEYSSLYHPIGEVKELEVFGYDE